MSEHSCTSYSPGHNIHFIQVKLASQRPTEARSVQLIGIEGQWFDVLIDGGPCRGWHHSAKAVQQFFDTAHLHRALEDEGGYPDPALATAQGPETLRDLHHGDGFPGQIIWHRVSGGALSVNCGEQGRAFLSVCWRTPEDCHVNITYYPDGSVGRG